MNLDVIKMNKYAMSAACMCALCTGLTGCGDSEEETSATTSPAATTQTETPSAAAADDAAKAADAQKAAAKALQDYLLRTMGNHAIELANSLEWNGEVREMLDLMNKSAEAMKAAGQTSKEYAELLLMIADARSYLGAHKLAEENYQTARTAFDALPEDFRNAEEGQRWLSRIQSGIGCSLLNTDRAADAITAYNASLETDKKRYANWKAEADAARKQEAAQATDSAATGEQPAETAKPSGEALTIAATEADPITSDLLSSYRCLGESTAYSGDIEEARTIYEQGRKQAFELGTLGTKTAWQFVLLLGNAGNLEVDAGNKKVALQAWLQSLQICEQLGKQCPDLRMRAKFISHYQQLMPNAVALNKELQTEASAIPPAATEGQPSDDTMLMDPTKQDEEPGADVNDAVAPLTL